MTFRCLILCFLLIMLSAPSHAAVIRGKIDSPDAPVRLLKYIDHITTSQIQMAETASDKHGAFEINIPAGELEKYKIVAGDVVAELFLTKTSVVSLTQKDTQLLIDDGDNGINRRLDSLFTSYVAWNKKNDELSRTPEEALRDLRNIESAFRRSGENRWNQLLESYIAKSELFYTTVGRNKIDKPGASNAFDELEQKVLINGRIDQSNPFYIAFFEHYMYSRINLTGFRRLKGGMNPFSKAIGEASYFENDSLRELAAVLGIKKLYERQWYGRSNSISELDDSVQSLLPKMKIPYFRKALENISEINHRFKRGDSFPIILLNDAKRKKTDISQINSEYILVSFWATWCGPCRRSMTHYEDLLKQFGNKLSIVSISADRQFETMQSYLESSNYIGKWLALHNGDKGKYLDAIKIDGYPTYFLLDKNKKVITSPKWDELEETLATLIK